MVVGDGEAVVVDDLTVGTGIGVDGSREFEVCRVLAGGSVLERAVVQAGGAGGEACCQDGEEEERFHLNLTAMASVMLMT